MCFINIYVHVVEYICSQLFKIRVHKKFETVSLIKSLKCSLIIMNPRCTSLCLVGREHSFQFSFAGGLLFHYIVWIYSNQVSGTTVLQYQTPLCFILDEKIV